MRSTAARHDLSPITTSVGDLLVLWQHPAERAILPIGRFGFDGRTYSFDYTRTAQEIEGFRPLPGLRDLGRHYESTSLFPAFRNRVMTPGRPDYESYLRTLGLDAAELSPWEQIVRSGGAREGDTLQFVQVPTPRNGHLDTRFLAHGVRHIPASRRTLNGRNVEVSRDQHEKSLMSLAQGDRLDLLPEEGSVHSGSATIVASTASTPWGMFPRCSPRASAT